MPEQPPRTPFAHIPEQGDDPIVWDPQQRRFVPTSEVLSPGTEMAAPVVVTPQPAAGRDGPHYFVGSNAVGKAPPPRDGTPPVAAGARNAAGAAAAAAVLVPGAPPPPPVAPPPVPPARPAPAPAPLPLARPKRRGPRLRRPKVPK